MPKVIYQRYVLIIQLPLSTMLTRGRIGEMCKSSIMERNGYNSVHRTDQYDKVLNYVSIWITFMSQPDYCICDSGSDSFHRAAEGVHATKHALVCH